ncbi:MAG: 1,4-alpha-glucan branching protein GlgB [Myxococcota bacterium]|nr:1,4-alpha-glucan branching protein GlgB [Myxococcota bacterium]
MSATPAVADDEGRGRLREALLASELAEPQRLLGLHSRDGNGFAVAVWHPEASGAELLLDDGVVQPLDGGPWPGLFEGILTTALPPRYRVRFLFADSAPWEVDDPYRFPSSLGDLDLHLFAEGTHRSLWKVLGAHPCVLDGVEGVRFAVWAPRATRVSVVGDFCEWDGRRLPMRRAGYSGVFELFVPGLQPGARYKFEIKTADGSLRLKTDPFAFRMERPPECAARVERSGHVWSDDEWLAGRSPTPLHEPLSIYEVHLGSWRRQRDGSHLGYAELARQLVGHCRRFGFTHIELLPITEYPFDGSWGYQVSGYFAPTCRYGEPDDFKTFVDVCHQGGVGVILDWVPAHFPRDDFALRRFDGEPLYEYADPRLGEHPDWGTLVFDFGRNEVRNFLIASALFWLQEYHLDGLRVDAVASMLYRDYSREPGDWVPNLHGGRENLEAVSFLRELNRAVHEECPGCLTIAEESTAWPGVSRAEGEGGLGFTFKWNLGWMHDTLRYFGREPIHRRWHQDELTFASLYEHSEHFLMPLSHDEVVHGKGSLLSRMPGDDWQRFANLRVLLAYQYTRPGKKLLFMGTELAPSGEWDAGASLDWRLGEDPRRARFARFLEALGALYHAHPCLWRSDPSPEGFHWVDCDNREESILVYLRRFYDDELLVVLNLTPAPRPDYRIGVPRPGVWRALLCSDYTEFGGSGYGGRLRTESEPAPLHGEADSIRIALPPLSATVLTRDPS